MANGTQSFSLDLRDTFFNALDQQLFFSNFTKRKSKMLQVQPNLLPYLGVYMIPDEVMTPDGDWDAGCIRFIHECRIGFSVMIINNDDVIAERKIDAAFWVIMNTLWADPYIPNFIDTLNRDTGFQNVNNVRFEGIKRASRRHIFGNARDNETAVAELQYDVNVTYRTYWPPVITDELLEINVKTQMKPGDTQTDIDNRIQVEVPINFDPFRKGKESPNGRDNEQDGRPVEQHNERARQES